MTRHGGSFEGGRVLRACPVQWPQALQRIKQSPGRGDLPIFIDLNPILQHSLLFHLTGLSFLKTPLNLFFLKICLFLFFPQKSLGQVSSIICYKSCALLPFRLSRRACVLSLWININHVLSLFFLFYSCCTE